MKERLREYGLSTSGNKTELIVRLSQASKVPSTAPRYKDYLCLAVFALPPIIHLYLCPFTKVEESFHTQATHDLLYSPLHLYDHKTHPGVVPRSFLPAVILTTPLHPLTALFTKSLVHFFIRLLLGLAHTHAHFKIYQSLRQQYPAAAIPYCVITATQAHPNFYSTRLLPNSFATLLSLWSLNSILSDTATWAIAYQVISFTIVRCDMLIFAAPIGLTLLLSKKITFLNGVLAGIFAMSLSLIVSVPVDSYLWGIIPFWPELEVFKFNVFENRSSEYGTSPPPYYFLKVLPKVLTLSYPLLPFGIVTPSFKLNMTYVLTVIPALAFISLYSILPHKELRFILPAVPFLNVGASMAAANLPRRLRLCLLVGVALAGAGVTTVFLAASRVNYPGGRAFEMLHDRLRGEEGVRVLIRNEAAMTGVTRFGEVGDGWVYGKEGYEEENHHEFDGFDFVLSGDERLGDDWKVWDRVEGFEGFDWRNFKVLLGGGIWIHERGGDYGGD